MPTVSEALAAAIAHHQASRLPEAESLYRLCLQLNPASAEVHLNLALVLHDQNRLEEADQSYRAALNLAPTCAEAHNNLGTLYHQQGDFPGAIACYRRATELMPNYVAAHFNLGNAFRDQGDQSQAVNCYRRALALNPAFAEAHANLGNALDDLGRRAEAIDCCQQAIALKPDLAEAHNNLGVILYEQGHSEQAAACYQRALDSRPNYAQAHSNFAAALRSLARLDESIAYYRQTIALMPNSPAAYGGLLFTLHFSPSYDAATIFDECRRYGERAAAHLANSIQPHPNNPSPNRRLKLGYVSPNFRDHCQAFFTIPLLSQHDHQQFEIYLYSDVACSDGITACLRATADVWQNIAGLADEQVANLVRQDQIDILVDLTMHMDNSRLLVFARKPAPVQVTWLAYPGTTGLTAIDYRLTDSRLDPPALFDAFYSEQSIRLTDTFWCYDPLTSEPPVSPLPALANGYVTFGCLNNFCKVNDSVIDLWSQVLRAVTPSRLLLRAPEGADRQRTLQFFALRGIASDRIKFVGRQPRLSYLQTYNLIDIALDTLPYNGHTTSLDAFWMGVPVVTLVGQTVVGRAGLSQLTNLNLTELVAHTPNQFVQIAASLAADLPRLSQLRSTLRSRMEQSPLMDAPRFARSIESAYRQMWHRWCAPQ